MADIVATRLKEYEASKTEKYDPGQIVILFDNRVSRTADDKFTTLQTYYTSTLYRLGWPSFTTPNLPPGNVRLSWFTHAGNPGTRDFPLYKAYLVKEMFDSLSQEGFRPMVLGWSGENPYPMIGGSEPPPEPKPEKVRVATSWSGSVSGHGKGGVGVKTPLERVERVIEEEERREREGRRKEVLEVGMGEKGLNSPV